MTPEQSLAAGRMRELAIFARMRELRAELREILRDRERLLDDLSTPRPLLDAIGSDQAESGSRADWRYEPIPWTTDDHPSVRDEVRKAIGFAADRDLTIADLLTADSAAIRSMLSVAARYTLRIAIERLVYQHRSAIKDKDLAALLAELQPRPCPPGQPASTVGHPHGARTAPGAMKGGER